MVYVETLVKEALMVLEEKLVLVELEDLKDYQDQLVPLVFVDQLDQKEMLGQLDLQVLLGP